MQDNPKIARDANAKIECQAILILRENPKGARDFHVTIKSRVIQKMREIAT